MTEVKEELSGIKALIRKLFSPNDDK